VKQASSPTLNIIEEHEQEYWENTHCAGEFDVHGVPEKVPPQTPPGVPPPPETETAEWWWSQKKTDGCLFTSLVNANIKLAEVIDVNGAFAQKFIECLNNQGAGSFVTKGFTPAEFPGTKENKATVLMCKNVALFNHKYPNGNDARLTATFLKFAKVAPGDVENDYFNDEGLLGTTSFLNGPGEEKSPCELMEEAIIGGGSAVVGTTQIGGGVTDAHASMVNSVDCVAKQMTIRDPNSPNSLYTLSFNDAGVITNCQPPNQTTYPVPPTATKNATIDFAIIEKKPVKDTSPY